MTMISYRTSPSLAFKKLTVFALVFASVLAFVSTIIHEDGSSGQLRASRLLDHYRRDEQYSASIAEVRVVHDVEHYVSFAIEDDDATTLPGPSSHYPTEEPTLPPSFEVTESSTLGNEDEEETNVTAAGEPVLDVLHAQNDEVQEEQACDSPVFEWVPPADAAPESIQTWLDAYDAAMRRIRESNLGGELLRTLASNEVEELSNLRNDLFCVVKSDDDE